MGSEIYGKTVCAKGRKGNLGVKFHFSQQNDKPPLTGNSSLRVHSQQVNAKAKAKAIFAPIDS